MVPEYPLPLPEGHQRHHALNSMNGVSCKTSLLSISTLASLAILTDMHGLSTSKFVHGIPNNPCAKVRS